MIINYRGDDDLSYRLLSLLKEKIPIPILEIKKLRKQVYLAKTDFFWFIIKGFSSYKRLKIQEAFTYSLLQQGFQNTYHFYELDQQPILLNGLFFGCMEYLLPNNIAFTYKNKQDRIDAITLLEHYYQATTHLVHRYQYLLQPAQLLDKWKERVLIFKENIPIVRFYLEESMIKDIINWSERSLAYMDANALYFEKQEKVILHGDVAHHNFLRGKKNNNLYLIDFDLISIGPKSIDYLQFVNRILPHIQWSYQQLTKMSFLEPYLKENTFLAGIIYPTDLLREWNRLIRYNRISKQAELEQVIQLSYHHFYKRKKFVNKLMKRIDN